MASELELLNQALADRYRVSHEIGRGGMATVYHGHDVRHGRPVALKVLRPELAAVLGTERFLREITVTARLDHPHIVPLLDSGQAHGLLYYVMPFVDGESLRERLDREKQLPLADGVQIAREVADALSYAHSCGIVHRDIKPENILLGGGHARVADFGIARAVRTAGSESLTATGVAVGTLTYMSPEQASGEREIDARTDVYSLGCVVYEMLAGEPPYTGATPEAILMRKSVGEVPSLHLIRETVPAAVEQAIMKALAKAPADRFSSPSQFAEALTSDGTVASRARGGARARRAWRAGALAVLAAVAAAIMVAANVGGLRTRLSGDGNRPTTGSRAPIESLAVLPLENLSGDAEQAYFASGMHEALIVALGKLGGLRRVTARPSVLRYQRVDKPLRQVASELGVGALVTGTVLRSGNNVRITAHLIDPATENQLWSESYEREVRDVLALQNEIVAAIAREVQLRLSLTERVNLTNARQVNPAAYEAYLKARFHLHTFTREGHEKALTLLRQAIAIDSAEPLAHAELARAYLLTEVLRAAPSPEALPRAEAAALKALELDESLAEVHVVLAFVRACQWNYARVEQSSLRALQLNPNHPDSHINYATYLSIFGSPDSSIAEYKRGIDLDPLSPLYISWLGGLYWELRRPDEAIAEARKAMSLAPDFPIALFVLGLAHADKGEYAAAIAAHERARSMYPNRSYSWALARTYALAGRTADARRIMAGLEAGRPGDAVHPWFIAAPYVALGEHEKAMTWLEKGYEVRTFFLTNLKRDRAAGLDIRPLRTHPRFRALLRRVNLER